MQIHIYARQGDIAGVAGELANGVDLNSLDDYSSQTPLMKAATSPKAGIDMLQFLVDRGANINAVEGKYGDTVLSLAVESGNLDKIQFLLNGGANIHYQRPSGYDVLIDAMHGRDIAQDPNLIPILNLLIERGAKVSGVSDCGESAIGTASRLGRFDAVKFLLEAGADSNQLRWTELMYEIAFGSLAEVKELLDRGADLSARDFWDRTAWLLSIQVGEVEKAKLLLASGANRSDRGNCGQPAMMFAIGNDRAEVLEWLIGEGFDLEDTDKFDRTPLIVAVESGATDCTRILLANGANYHKLPSEFCDTLIETASNLEIARMLVEVGEDLSRISPDVRQELTGLKQSTKLK